LASEYDAAASLRPSEFANRIDEERVEEASASNVRVMTIHKSKGLEFDVVVLPDLDVDLFDTPKACVGCPEPAERPDTVILYRNGVLQKLLPPQLRRALEQQRRAEVHEALCCLYVAMTRAVHALHLVIAPQEPTKGGETTHLKTAAGLLRATLSLRPDLPPQTVLYEFGDARWYEELPPPKQDEVAPAAQHVRSSGTIALRSRAGGRGRGREAASPSQSKGGQRSPAARLLSLDAAFGMERGTLWHLWCQKLRWRDDVPLDPAHLAAVAQPYCRQASRLGEEVDAFCLALEKTSVRSLFDPASVAASRPELGPDLAVDCLTESRFSMLLDGRWLTGSVDRLVLYRRAGTLIGADVIDFKTDLAGEATPLRGAYREQIRQYAIAMARVYGIDAGSVRSMLVWLTTGTVEVVPAAPARSSLPPPRVSQPRLFGEDEEGR
jgi:ATP-dependent exoDNAse (exonuclease V) beta subunit